MRYSSVIRLDSGQAKECVRYDLARFGRKTTRTPQGFLKAPAFFTRAGVFEYDRGDGTKIRELRPDEEVFHEDSLATLRGAPLVEGHSAGMITPANAKALSFGWAGEKVERKDALVSGEVTVIDSQAIQDIGSGKLREISMGYRCKIESTSGEHPKYGRYDQIQRDIRYNHVGFGGSDWGRAGNDVAIRLDSGDAVQRTDADPLRHLVTQQASIAGLSMKALAEQVGVEEWELNSAISGWEAPSEALLKALALALQINIESLSKLVPNDDRIDRTDQGDPMETVTITIGGVQFDVPKAAGQAFQNDTERRDSETATLKAENDKLQGRFDAQGEELKTTKTKLEEAQDPKRFDSAVTGRIALLDRARKILPEGTEIQGTSREVMEQVIKHDSKDLDLTGKSADYVEARFDALLERPAEPKKPATKTAARVDAQTASTGEGGEISEEQSRADMAKRNAEAWQQPLTAHQ